MAQTIGDHGLYCPDPQDYAAYALYMQDVAERIDAALQEQLDGLDLFFNAPTIILTNSAAVNIPIIPGFNGTLFDTVVFNNSTFMSLDPAGTGVLVGSAAGAPVTVPYLRGSYTIGTTVVMTATGAVTANSARVLVLAAQDFTQPVGSPAVFEGTDQTLDTNTGGNFALLCTGQMFLQNISGVRVAAIAQHQNAASSVDVNAGTAFLWVTYNGPANIIEVA